MRASNLEDLLVEYRTAAAKAGSAKTALVANRAASRVAKIFKEIHRRGPESVIALTSLLGDEDESVRCWAASHMLVAAPEAALPTLESLAEGAPFAIRTAAAATLHQWRNGQLRFPL